MTDQWRGGQSGPGERWNVNLPAVVGVVFVFLVGVVIWVIASADDDELAIDGETSSQSSADLSVSSSSTALTLPVLTAPIATSPIPLPATTPVPAPTQPIATLAPATVAPPPPAAVTQAPPPPVENPATTQPAPLVTAPPAVNGGDLGVAGHPIQRPPCDGSAITILASAIGDEATADSMGEVLNDYAGSHYLRTDQTCPSLTQAQNGKPIYVVYFGPFTDVDDACAARSDGPDDSYVRKLSTDLAPGHGVTCS